MSLDTNTFKNFLINEMFEYDENGKRISRNEGEVKFNFLSTALRESNAVIAGGGVLAAYYEDSTLKDIDVYVNRKNAIKFKNRMIELGYSNFSELTIQPQYDRSFFVKNSIIARFPIAKKNANFSDPDIPYIDIIIVSDNVDVIQVVNNFDLTFCEIWYDGVNVNAANPRGILEKKGYLKPDYVIGLLKSLNSFTTRRMNKYTTKGFQIIYDNTAIKTDVIFEGNNSICSAGKSGCKVADPEKWVVSMILRSIIRDMFNPDYIEYFDINNIKNTYRNEEFDELLRILNAKPHWGEPRLKEAYNFFQNIIFDIFCMCDLNDYSLNSLTNIFNCLGVPMDKRREYTISILSFYDFDNEYLNYINTVLGISYRDMIDFTERRKRKENTIVIQPRKRKFDEEEEEEENMIIQTRKRKFDDEEEEEEEEEMEEEEEGAQEPKERDYNPDDYRRSMARKRKFDDDEEETEENSDFVAADISNITTRLANLRAREDDNIITKKPRRNTDSGEYDNVVFEIKSNNGDFRKVNFDRSYLKTIIRNKNNLFFECTTANKITTPIVIYVKMPLNHRKTHYCFIPIDSIKEILQNNSKTYHLYPVLQNRKQKIIQNSGSLNNLNICRSHEKIPVYRIQSTPRVYFEGTEISERF